MDGFTRIIRGVVILAFATSAGIYSEFVVDFFTQVPGAIASEIAMGGSSGRFSMSDDTATAGMLDSAMAAGVNAGKGAWQQMSMLDIGPSVGYGVIALLIWVFVALVCAYAGALVLVANIGLSVMLGIGPLFIILAMFESTQQLFVAWTRQLITFAVFFIVLAASVSITFSFFTPFVEMVGEAQFDAGGVSMVVITFVKMIGFCAASLIVLWQSTSWASGLAGGVSVAGAGAVGRMVGSGTKAAGATAGSIARRARDPRTGAKEWRGAVPAAAGVAVKAAAYMRRNQIKHT